MVIAQFVITSTDRLEMYGFNHWELLWNICRTILVLLGLSPCFTLQLITREYNPPLFPDHDIHVRNLLYS